MQRHKYSRQMNNFSDNHNFNQIPQQQPISPLTNTWNTQQHPSTPYEVFAKPELPLQSLQQGQGNMLNSAQPNQQFIPGEGENPLKFDKVMNTVGQLASTYHQVSPIIKEFSTFVKTFR
ncbi:YppG family protein [Oceanobacillus sp. 1P07AA]|uniref:YppG family protein n=1 Tax=Oceanobacillus sp. 1P07AA TaxID=3132293 RepID=UPI0039A6D836